MHFFRAKMSCPQSWLNSCAYEGEAQVYFGQLILRKIIKIVATRCHILWLKCTKFDFGWGSAPDPSRGSAHRSHRPPGWIWAGPTSNAREGNGMKEKGKEKKREERGKRREGKEGEVQSWLFFLGGGGHGRPWTFAWLDKTVYSTILGRAGIRWNNWSEYSATQVLEYSNNIRIICKVGISRFLKR